MKATVILLIVIVICLLVRYIGQRGNRRVPDGGINTDMYVEINGVKQWISIYGQDINNPVLLYLHGGPGVATSGYDYAFTRKWSDVYTIVTWDQRNCGKSYSEEQDKIAITEELLISDGMEMTKFLLDYLKKDKITLLGHSWGTYLGCHLIHAAPEYYHCYIGAGQMVGVYLNEVALRIEAARWVGEDEEGQALVGKLTVGNFTEDYYAARNMLLKKYNYDMFAAGTDYSLLGAQFFNPYYSLRDIYQMLHSDHRVYGTFISSDDFVKCSLMDKTEYRIPFYNINGDKDYQTNYLLAQDYFERITAPQKEMYIMKNMTHGLLESRSEEFSRIVHQIAKKAAPK